MTILEIDVNFGKNLFAHVHGGFTCRHVFLSVPKSHPLGIYNYENA